MHHGEQALPQQQKLVELQVHHAASSSVSSFQSHEAQGVSSPTKHYPSSPSPYTINFPLELQSPSLLCRSDSRLHLQGCRALRSSSSRALSYNVSESNESDVPGKVHTDVFPLLQGTDFDEAEEDESLGIEKVEEVSRAGATVRSAVFNVSTTIIGAGIMALPATLRVLGVPTGLIVMLLMGILSEVSLEMVVRYTAQMRASNYGEMVEGACGWKGRLLAQLAIIVNNGGILIVYLIIMGDVLSGSPNHTGLFQGWAGGDGWWSNRTLVILLTMVLVLSPLASLKRIDSLEISSTISVGLALMFVLLSSAIAVIKFGQGKLLRPRMLPSLGSKKELVDLFTVVPIMTNAFVCQFNIPPIYNELQERSAPRMNRVGRISILLCVAVYMATALSAYLLFGEFTAADVLSNFDADLGIPYSDFLTNVIRIGYVIHLMLVFPVVHFSFRQTVDSLFFPEARTLSESNLRFFGVTFVLLTLIFIGSTLIPNIWIAFQFTGATTGLSLCFMFPALVVIRSKDGSLCEQRTAWGMLSMSMVVSIVGVSTQIYAFAAK